jgi:hypothetical protein
MLSPDVDALLAISFVGGATPFEIDLDALSIVDDTPEFLHLDLFAVAKGAIFA